MDWRGGLVRAGYWFGFVLLAVASVLALPAFLFGRKAWRGTMGFLFAVLAGPVFADWWLGFFVAGEAA